MTIIQCVLDYYDEGVAYCRIQRPDGGWQETKMPAEELEQEGVEEGEAFSIECYVMRKLG